MQTKSLYWEDGGNLIMLWKKLIFHLTLGAEPSGGIEILHTFLGNKGQILLKFVNSRLNSTFFSRVMQM